MAIPAFEKVRHNSVQSAMNNDARQIASAAQQYFLEHSVTSVPFAYDPATGAVSGPLSSYVKQLGKGYTRTPRMLQADGTFQLAHPQLGAPVTYDMEGKRKR